MMAFVAPAIPVVFAQATSSPVQEDSDPDGRSLKRELDAIQDEVRAKERQVQALDEVVDQYRKKVQQQASTAKTLKDQLALLDARMEEVRASQARSKAEGERLATEIHLLESQIEQATNTLTVRRALLETVLARLASRDRSSPLVSALSRRSLSAFVSEREEWRSLQRELGRLTQEVRETRTQLEGRYAAEQEAKRKQEEEAIRLEGLAHQLEEDQEAKANLIAETQNREEEYRRLMANIAAQQQAEATALDTLRSRLQDTLDRSDEVLARGDILLSWPVPTRRGISAYFHDTSYPFRTLFEHTGVDVPVPVGTPVRSAAGGYVAWNRRGKQYGNYVMVIHPSGIATVYAHLSAFGAKPDTYVERGEIIGYSGGKAGDPGAGLSTGPHLHFEVRQDGIPVNPMLFLPEL